MVISIITGNLCCIKHKTRTAKVTICMISKRLLNRLDSYRTPQSGDALPPREAQSIVVTHRHPRMNVKAVSVTQWCLFAQQSTETPKLLKGHRRRTAGEQMGGSPKASTTASGRGNQPAGRDPESNRSSPGPRDIKRDGSRYRVGPRSSHNQGPVHASVTVVTASSGKS